jgi:hypothetical protein
MLRRTLLRALASAAALKSFAPFRLFAQGAAATIGPAEIATLNALAEVVLPGAIGRFGREQAVRAFASWVRNYRAGADMGHGYGASTLRARSGPSPAAKYPPQFAALDEEARKAGAASFAALAFDGRRAIVEASLNQAPGVTRLPARPTGANLIADFMGHYFSSAPAWNLAYNAAIDREDCRSLDDSAKPPAPLKLG